LLATDVVRNTRIEAAEHDVVRERLIAQNICWLAAQDEQVVAPTERRRRLIHDAARRLRDTVFGLLGDPRQRQWLRRAFQHPKQSAQ
jgi:hypothetical protein